MEGLEKKHIGEVGGIVLDHGVVPPVLEQCELAKSSEIVELSEEGYSWEDLHRTIKDGRITCTDPIIGNWRWRPLGVDNTTWGNVPQCHSRHRGA